MLAPSGTISIVLGGMAIGPLAGVLYFTAMLIAGVIVYSLARPAPGQAERLIRRFAPGRNARRYGRLALRRMRRRPIAATAALRLVPVVPSAGCALILAGAGISLRGLILGTLAAGWVRPLAFAVFSAEVWRSIQSGTFSLEALAGNPAVWISAFCIAAPVAIILISNKLESGRE